MRHLVLVDGHHLLYRAYWAIPRTMKTKAGTQVNTVFGVASMIIQILKTEEPDALLFCFDDGSETFRHEAYDDYKAGRAETPDDFYPQIPLVREMLDAFGIPAVSLTTHEADDLLCAYAAEADRHGWRTTIVTGDRDVLQLASPTVRIAIPAKGYQVPEYLDHEKVKEKYGVTPEQIPSYKALTGDPSDNLKGVTGIGPKAAAALVSEWGTIDRIYEHLDEIKPSWREKLVAGKESAFFCLKMSELVCDFPLPLAFDALTLTDRDLDPVLSFFREQEFSLLTKRLLSFAETTYGRAHFRLPEGFVPSASSASSAAASPVAQLSLL